MFWCQVLLEPYSRSYYFGSERVSKRYGTEPEQDGCAYKDIKAMCEQPFSGCYLLSYHLVILQKHVLVDMHWFLMYNGYAPDILFIKRYAQ